MSRTITTFLLLSLLPGAASWLPTSPRSEAPVQSFCPDPPPLARANPDIPPNRAQIGYLSAQRDEVLQLRDAIQTCRDRIEAGRARELQRAGEAYRSTLASIAPRDMFETDDEHRQRVARERSNASLNRARSQAELHITFDSLLNRHVEPLFERIRFLLVQHEIVPRDGVIVRLDEYDPENEVFVGTVAIDSRLLKDEARVIVPIRRESAREVWENRGSLIAEVSLSIDVFSLAFRADWVSVSAPSSRPRHRGFLAQEALRASARDVAGAQDARAAVRSYNHLLVEAKLTLPADRHIQALSTLPDPNGSDIALASKLGSASTAAKGLEAYFTSFRSRDAFRSSARELARRAAAGEDRCCIVGTSQLIAVNVLIAEYNRLIGEAKSVFANDANIRALSQLGYVHGRDRDVGRAEWNSLSTTAQRLAQTFERSGDPSRDVAETTAAQGSHTPLSYVPYSSRFSANAQRLARILGRSFSPDARDQGGWTDLHYAAALGLTDLASALLDAGADPRAELNGDPYASGALGVLTYFGVDIPNFPIGRRTSFRDLTRLRGASPLHIAARTDAEGVAAKLLSAGAEVDARMIGGLTPLHVGAGSAARAVAELLLEQGAAVNATDREGWPPHYYTKIRCETGDVFGGLATEELLERYGGKCELQICAFTSSQCVSR